MFRDAFLVRGTILRIADLRFESAYITVVVRRPTSSRRMVEFSFVPHLGNTGKRRSSRHPGACQKASQAPNLWFVAPKKEPAGP